MRKSLVFVALLLCGCETSKFPNDPRAVDTKSDSFYKIRGKEKLNYLDYVFKYPPDKDTEGYRPRLYVKGVSINPDTNRVGSMVPKEIQDLMTP